jgi:hypothetical protein
VCMYVCMCLYVCVCMYVYVCVCVYAHLRDVVGHGLSELGLIHIELGFIHICSIKEWV